MSSSTRVAQWKEGGKPAGLAVAVLALLAVCAVAIYVGSWAVVAPVGTTDIQYDLVAFYSVFLGMAALMMVAALVNSIRMWFGRPLVRPTKWCALSRAEALMLVAYVGLSAWWFQHYYRKLDHADPPTADSVIARSFGHMVDLHIPLLFIPVSRNSIWEHLFGISFERAIKFHRWIGRMTVLFLTTHITLWFVHWGQNNILIANAFTYNGYIAGFADYTIPYAELAWICAVIMFFTALEPVRRRHFEVFYYTHHLFLVFVIFANIHSWEQWKYLLPCGGLYIGDRAFRIYRSQCATQLVSASTESCLGGLTKLTMTKRDWRHEPGQYLFLNIPRISLLQWHPFTISSHGDSSVFTCHIKNMGDDKFTGQLHELARTQVPFDVNVDGPYGALSIIPADYKTVLCVSGGIGITPMISLAYHCVARQITVHFLWSVRDPAALDISCFTDLCHWATEEGRSKYLKVTVYLTSLRESQVGVSPLHDSSSSPSSPSVTSNGLAEQFVPRLAGGRPRMEKILQGLSEEAASRHEPRIGVFVCGPTEMVLELRTHCHDCTANNTKHSHRGVVFDVHAETFFL